MVCGGIPVGETASSNCYVLYNDTIPPNEVKSFQWVKTTPMSQSRTHAGSVQVLEGGLTNEYNWWVSGGLDINENPLSTSEVRQMDGIWIPGPELPIKVYGHCVIQIQRQKSVLIGGLPFHDNYIYDWVSKVCIKHIKKKF